MKIIAVGDSKEELIDRTQIIIHATCRGGLRCKRPTGEGDGLAFQSSFAQNPFSRITQLTKWDIDPGNS